MGGRGSSYNRSILPPTPVLAQVIDDDDDQDDQQQAQPLHALRVVEHFHTALRKTCAHKGVCVRARRLPEQNAQHRYCPPSCKADHARFLQTGAGFKADACAGKLRREG